MKRRTERKPVDYAADRDRWAALILQAHQAVEADTPDARARLAERAVTARNVWTPPAPYPQGLVVQAFAQAAYAWGRQTDRDLQAGAAALMLQAASLADIVIVRAAEAAPMPTLPPRAYRAPYADA